MAWFKSNKVEIANILKGISDPASSIGDNGQLYLKYIDIADAYSLREYIEVGNTAGPYINTRLFWSQSNEFEVKAQFMAEPDWDTFVFGCWVSYQDTNIGYGNGWQLMVGGSGITGQQYDTNAHVYKAEQNSILLDGSVLSGTPNWNNVPTNVPIAIFTDGARLTEKRIKNTRVYYAKIWDNGELTHYFVPAIRKSDDEIGMLDIMTSTFYDNDGSGDFTISSTERTDIEGKPIISSFAKVNDAWQNLIGTDVDDISYVNNSPTSDIGCPKIFDDADRIDGKYINRYNGREETDDPNSSCTDFIDISDYDFFIIDYNCDDWQNLGYNAFYDASKQYIEGFSLERNQLNMIDNIPTSAKYIRFSWNSANESYAYGGNLGIKNPIFKKGTFVSASSQFGIVDVVCGFKPDLVMVKLPFTGGDTVSYWEKGLSYAQNSAIWCLKPVEDVAYEVALGRVDGETGIQAINDDGFSFMSNGGNTLNITCEYIAVQYEAEPTPIIPFKKEILHSITQDQSGSSVPVSVTFTENYQIAFICGLIADNVGTGNISVNAFGGASELYGDYWERYVSAGIAIQLPSNKTLTGYFPYSDGGAYYDIFGAIGMSKLPSEYEVQATIDTSNISIELSKVYDHLVVFVGMDSTDSNSMTLAMNGTSIPLTVESEKFSRYSYHASEELTINSATLNFTYSGGTVADNTIVVFAYNE